MWGVLEYRGVFRCLTMEESGICCLTRKWEWVAEHLWSIRGASLEHRWSIQGACKEHFGGIWGAWGVRGRDDGAGDVGGVW